MQPFELKPFQRQALLALQKTPAHVICVAPTGSGKSLIFERQIATGKHKALLISPLVALARQQWQRVREESNQDCDVKLGSGRPSDGPPAGRGAWIVSPETLLTPTKKRAMEQWSPDLLIVDECHCLWDWGDRFRPAFSELPSLISRLGIRRSLWLTATLPRAAREELKSRLPPVIEIGEFDLPESLEIQIQQVAWSERIEKLLQWIHMKQEPGIVFTGTRDTTERIRRILLASGVPAAAYHAGMSQEERRAIEGAISMGHPRVVVATSAFGMGMNHRHLAWAAMLQPSASILALTQAIGRAGRNPSTRAQALILWDDDDFRLLEWTLQGSERRKQELLEVRRFLSARECRRVSLRKYFNEAETISEWCGLCDRCNGLP